MPATDKVISRWLDKVDIAEVIVFDLDGTLIETDAANVLAYDAAIRHCLDQSPQVPLDLTVRVTREALHEWLPASTQAVIQDIVAYKENVYEQFLATTKVSQPMLRLLEVAQGKDVVLATNSRRARAELLLSHHGLSAKFTRKYFREDDTHINKYERVFGHLDINPVRIVVFDDDPESIAEAIAAGAKPNDVFLVTNPC